MPPTDTAPLTPAAPPAAPATPPPAPAAPATPKPDSKAERHPGVSKLMGSLFKQADEPKKKEEEPAPAAPKDPPPPTPAPVVEDKPIRVKKPKRPDLPIPTKPVTAASPAPTPAPVAPTPAPTEELDEHEQQALTDARDLEKIFPQKHAGLAAKTEKYLRGHIAMLKKMRELHGEDFDGEDPDYKKWLSANKPGLTSRDMEDLRTTRIRNEVMQESDRKHEEVKHELFVRDEMPKIKKEGLGIYKKLAEECLPPEVADLVQTKGIEEANKYYKVELQVTDSIIQAAAEDAELFLQLTTNNPKTNRPMVAFDPNNEQHQRLSEMVLEVCDSFKNSAPVAEQKRNGKWFVTRDEWNAMAEADRGQYWTFTNKEILNQATKAIPAVVKASINQRHKEREAEGYIRAPRPAAAAPAPAPAPAAPPAPRPTPAPPGRPQIPGASQDPRTRTLAANLQRQ